MEPAYTPPQHSAQTAEAKSADRKRRAIALWLLIGPTALIVGSLFLYAIVNFLLSAGAPEATTGATAIAEQNPIQSILNVILFALGAVSVITWFPGLIIGIILLTTGRK